MLETMSVSYQLFFCFLPDSKAPKRTRADVSYFRREQSPPIPEGFLEFLYLTKISYRERIMNHELGDHVVFASQSCHLLPTNLP